MFGEYFRFQRRYLNVIESPCEMKLKVITISSDFISNEITHPKQAANRTPSSLQKPKSFPKKQASTKQYEQGSVLRRNQPFR